MAIKIKTEKTVIEMHPNDGFVIELELENSEGDPINVSSEDFLIRFMVKTITQIPLSDQDRLYHDVAEKTEINNVVSLRFDPTKTNFPVSKKPHYLIVQISNSKTKFSREFYYELYVLQSGMRTIY